MDGQLIVRDLDPFHPYQHDLKDTIVQRFSANSSQTHMLIVGLHQVALWNMEASPQLLKVLSDPETIYNCAIALPDDRGWLVGDRSGNIHHFVRKGDALVINGPPRKSGNTWINDLAMHPDGKRFASVGKPHNGQQTAVELWNLENLEATRLKTFTGTLFAVTIDSSGQYVAYAGDTKAPTLRAKWSVRCSISSTRAAESEAQSSGKVVAVESHLSDYLPCDGTSSEGPEEGLGKDGEETTPESV